MHVRRYHADGRVDDWIDPEDVSESLGQRGELLWVDLEDPTSEDIALLAQEFGVHHLAAEDLLEPSSRPHLGRYHDHYLLAVRDLSYEDGRLGSREVDLVFGDGWIISVRKSGDGGLKPAPIDEIVRRFERQRQGEGATDEGFLLWVFLDAAIERFFEVSDALEDSLEEVEETIFDTDGADKGQDTRPQAVESRITERLYRLRRDQVTFRRLVAPLREAIGPFLRQEVDFIGDAAVLHLRDAYDLVTRVTETADAHRDLLNGALEAHLSITSNRMNLVMKRATSWGAILVSATLVAGIYGMNFRDMPELGWRYGYPLALGLMGLITLILYRMFKRKDWL